MDLNEVILTSTKAKSISAVNEVQSLWSGYGSIKRYLLVDSYFKSIIVKHIQWPEIVLHPHGWSTEFSHQRKLKSYHVEKCWYSEYACELVNQCKVPQMLKSIENEKELILILEDLDEVGYRLRYTPEVVTIKSVKDCLKWLANFHSHFLGKVPKNLWQPGTYWHLATRPDELAQMTNRKLKTAAAKIDQVLHNAEFQTFVHGDAKLANFCFDEDDGVAAVDFQYVGGGPGVKDVAYFLSSCFDEEQLLRYADELLVYYFEVLEQIIDKSIDFQQLKSEWEKLYSYAWADFYRFLDGWSPYHWKIHGYSRKLTDHVLQEILE